jgi:hypothetical protein
MRSSYESSNARAYFGDGPGTGIGDLDAIAQPQRLGRETKWLTVLRWVELWQIKSLPPRTVEGRHARVALPPQVVVEQKVALGDFS